MTGRSILRKLTDEEVKALDHEMVYILYTDWDARVNGKEVHCYNESTSYPLVATKAGNWYSDGELLIHYLVWNEQPTVTMYRLTGAYGVIID